MSARFGDTKVSVERLDVSAYRIPTDSPEADGTYTWDSTTLVVIEAQAGGIRSLGYTYADTATAQLIRDGLTPVVVGCDAMSIPDTWDRMCHAVRNLGRPGIATMAIAGVDAALWDLKARLLNLPLAVLLGMAQESVPVYGSGGFTSYSDEQLEDQLDGWAAEGIQRVKMKIGTCPQDDLHRVQVARQAIGPDVELFVDANGAYSRKQALAFADAFAALGVHWFEEPVPADDFEGLRLIRDRAPAGMDIAAGEYGYELYYFRRLIDTVNVLQADASRCAGITGFLQVRALCRASTPFTGLLCTRSCSSHGIFPRPCPHRTSAV